MERPRTAPEWLRFRLPAGSFEAWALGVAIIALAIAVKALLDRVAGEPLPPYITLYPAIVIAGFFGGRSVGLGAAWTSMLIAWYLWIPYNYSFVVASKPVLITLCVFAVTGSFLGWASGWARTAFDQAKANEAERTVAARESVHRIKNLIAVTQALIHKIAREVSNVDGFASLLSKRLSALGQAQDVLLRRDWHDADLQEVVQSALAPFLPNPGLKVETGPPVTVPARFISGLSLALYELSTNAMKYGALADGRGPVNLSWSVVDGHCILVWRETPPNPVAQEARSGLGTQLIQLALARETGTSVRYIAIGSSVSAQFSWPAQAAS